MILRPNTRSWQKYELKIYFMSQIKPNRTTKLCNSYETKLPWTRGQEMFVSNLKTHLTFLSTCTNSYFAITKSIQRNCCNLLYIENRDRFDSIIPRQSCTGLSETGGAGGCRGYHGISRFWQIRSPWAGVCCGPCNPSKWGGGDIWGWLEVRRPLRSGGLLLASSVWDAVKGHCALGDPGVARCWEMAIIACGRHLAVQSAIVEQQWETGVHCMWSVVEWLIG